MKRKKVTGMFDNLASKCREYWVDGKVISSIPAMNIIDYRRACLPEYRANIGLWRFFPDAPILREFTLKPAYAIKLGDIIALQKPNGEWLHAPVLSFSQMVPSVHRPHGGIQLQLPDGREYNPEYDPKWQPEECKTRIKMFVHPDTDPDRLVLVEINPKEIIEHD